MSFKALNWFVYNVNHCNIHVSKVALQKCFKFSNLILKTPLIFQAFKISWIVEELFVWFRYDCYDNALANKGQNHSSIVHGLVGHHDARFATNSLDQRKPRTCADFLLLKWFWLYLHGLFIQLFADAEINWEHSYFLHDLVILTFKLGQQIILWLTFSKHFFRLCNFVVQSWHSLLSFENKQ